MWQQTSDEVFESNLQYEIFKGDHDDFRTIVKLCLKETDQDILKSIADIDNYTNIFPIVYELIDANKVLTQDLITILTRSDHAKAYAIYSLF